MPTDPLLTVGSSVDSFVKASAALETAVHLL